MNSTKTAPVNGISLVCVPTLEQDRAIAFYESLGFEKRTDIAFGLGYRWVEVYPATRNDRHRDRATAPDYGSRPSAETLPPGCANGHPRRAA